MLHTSLPPSVDIVVPCYNEEQVLPETLERLGALRDGLMADGKIGPDSRVYFVDDGSKDRTWELISSAAQADPAVVGVKLSRNQGHQAALLAGLHLAQGDAVVSIDADLQDDLDAMRQMIDYFLAGSQVVYGVRRQRGNDTAFKRLTARGFYKLMHVMGVEIVYDHADYRLLGRKALDALQQFDERNLFLRGIVPLLGFDTATVYYDRAERFAGESKYPVSKMLAFALDGITSFSTMPLRWVSIFGAATFAISLVVSLWVLVIRLTGSGVPGWASTLLPLLLLGGGQIICLGVVGSYVGRLYQEVKRRPRYIVEQVARDDENQ